MPPIVATLLWLTLLLLLLRYDPARETGVSFAIWVPVIWMFFVASRLPNLWLGAQAGLAAEAFQEGSPLDRTVFLVLISLATGVLFLRSFRWGAFFAQNTMLTALLFFALVSVFWADFPLIAFKRWFRDFGHYLAILVVLSDPLPVDAVRTLFRRLSYLAIPLSVLLIKYYPLQGMQYSEWTGSSMFVGVATSKNTFGALCLVSGLFFFWDTVSRWPNRKEGRTKRILLVNIVFLVMTLWLLSLANSATSRVCLAIGCLVILAVHSKWGRRHTTFVKVLIPACFCLYVILAFGFGLNGELAGRLGRDPTLTDRTAIWEILLRADTAPLIGTGYESFWLGSRLAWLWQQNATRGINEAHNGYLEVYLSLGFVGLLLLVGFLISSYRGICKRLSSLPGTASLGLALWMVIVFYNMTEAAFIGFHLIWVVFLLGAMVVPVRTEDTIPVLSRSNEVGSKERFKGDRFDVKVHQHRTVPQQSNQRNSVRSKNLHLPKN